jgi:Zn-dependent peptidase ImmA (M78 family)/transcriptional regulator with XRE-family HTH domain
MPYRTPELTISPSVLKWARRTAGYTPDDIANRLGVSRELVGVWEKGSGQVPLRVTQLEDLAHFLKRPLAAFLLAEPPPEPEPPRDFRRATGQSGPFSPDLRLVIRRSRRLQRVARELMESMGISTTSGIPTAELWDEPALVGRELRKAFGVSTQEQLKWKSPWMALRHWQQTLETRNILVFQGDFSREEAQGFSISDEHPYAIILTSKDHPNARSFTLFHELGHLLLREGGVCRTEPAYPTRETKITRTENWCHRFAEAFLIDDDILRSKEGTQSIIRMDPSYEDELNKLAFQFKVSRAVILFRLWHGELISDSLFWSMYSKLQQMPKPKAERKEEKKKGGLPPAQRALHERGRFLSRLILEALDRNILGYTDAADYLGVRPQHFEKIRLAAYG